MNSSFLNLNYPDPFFTYAPHAKRLVVILHSISSPHDRLADVKAAARDAYGEDGVDIYAPILPYSQRFDRTGAGATVVNLVADLDAVWDNKDGKKYEKVVLIGHSLGGILLRRVFLAGSLNPPDYSVGDFHKRDDLWGPIAEKRNKELPCEWAKRVERIVLLATWDKGWSLSDRIGWLYSSGLNVLGLIGRLLELLEGINIKIDAPGRTMLDVRKGAPFIVQTRLLWMAYRRWHNERLRKLYNEAGPLTRLAEPDPALTANPLVVQIIGAQDNFVSPQDQVDMDVEAMAWKEGDGADQNKCYFLFQMRATDHAGVVDFSNRIGRTRGLRKEPIEEQPEVLAHRRQVLSDALTMRRSELSQRSLDPTLLFDQLSKFDLKTTDVVLVMHGIRDDGYWTHRIVEAIKNADEDRRKGASGTSAPIESCAPTYGYFPMGAFIMPWIRRQKVEWFMDLYVQLRARFPRATVHYVGHSNGTYLAANALARYPAARFGRIYFAGSVVNPTFDWARMVTEERVKQFHSARGGTDWVVAWLPKSLEFFTDLGGGGFDTFESAALGHPKITQSATFARGGHGGAIEEPHWPQIAKFIIEGAQPFANNEHTGEHDPFMERPDGWIEGFSRFRAGVPLVFSIAALFALLAFSLWLPFENWRWGPTDLSIFGGWGSHLWIIALAAFLALHYATKQAPRGKLAILLTVLFAFCTLGIANFILTSFVRESQQFGLLNPVEYSVALRTAGAFVTLTGLIAAMRFVLTRF